MASKIEIESNNLGTLFDRVLVDAECTTDGRQHEVTEEEAGYKKQRWGNNNTYSREDEIAIEYLQLQLLINGFRLLKPGGSLVYSTCSLLEGQNEGVLSRFLETEPRAKLLVPSPEYETKPPSFVVLSETLGNYGWRLTPDRTGTSGLFISKLTKL